MATYDAEQNLPTWIQVARKKALVISRRGKNGLWAGRATQILAIAKKGYVTEEAEVVEWRKVANNCMVCHETNPLKMEWQGPGKEKPYHVSRKSEELSSMRPKPVKVLENYICGNCRYDHVARVTFITQWDTSYRGVEDGTRRCVCKWTGEWLKECHSCQQAKRAGNLTDASQAEGWQVRKFVDPLKDLFLTTGKPEEVPVQPLIPSIIDAGVQPSGPVWNTMGQEFTTPPPYSPRTTLEDLWSENCSAEMDKIWSETLEAGRNSQVWRQAWREVIKNGWPYMSNMDQHSQGPFGCKATPFSFRVYRPLDEGAGREVGIGALPEPAKEIASEGGWDGQWELVTWGQLIEEIFADEEIPMRETGGTIPREEGRRTSNLWYYADCLDGWGHQSAEPRTKEKVVLITPEEWHRNGQKQIPGSPVTWAPKPSHPEESVRVRITVKMVVVPLKGIYSLGVDIEAVQREELELEEEETPLHPKRGRRVRRIWQNVRSKLGLCNRGGQQL